MEKRLQFLKSITEAPGIPGFEGQVREIIRSELKDFCELSTDKLGSIICKKEGSAGSPRIMLSGHMDEIGFLVKRITDKGFLTFTTLGGWWPQVLLAQRVQVLTKDGPVHGIIGSTPPHILDEEERKKPVKTKDMFIDIGVKDKEEAEKLKVRQGDPIIPNAEFIVMANGDSLMSKAWDDRVGCALFVHLLQDLVGADHPNTIFGVGSVQEEVGLRGARTSSQKIKPDVGIALEVGIAGDVPGSKEDQAQGKLGAGPVILLYDGSLVPNVQLRDLVIDIAQESDIPYQFDVMERGGTDAGAIQFVQEGVPCLVLSVPTRYIHSHYSIISKADYFNTLRLLKEVVLRLDSENVAKLTAY